MYAGAETGEVGWTAFLAVDDSGSTVEAFTLLARVFATSIVSSSPTTSSTSGSSDGALNTDFCLSGEPEGLDGRGGRLDWEAVLALAGDGEGDLEDKSRRSD